VLRTSPVEYAVSKGVRVGKGRAALLFNRLQGRGLALVANGLRTVERTACTRTIRIAGPCSFDET